MVCTAISNGEFYKRRCCGSEQRCTATQRTKSGIRARDDEPLLSTSALKHRGVTIIFNHDYDRIIFRNETVNLVSHDCHSYLHVILTNGIPLCKALVMAGESDVDEEVYDNGGDERNEAREASAGDRRAIADEDQAGQLDISGEAKTARSLRTPEPPTDAARMAHNATHVPFRDWCPICVASRGRSSPHRRVVVNKTGDSLQKSVRVTH